MKRKQKKNTYCLALVYVLFSFWQTTDMVPIGNKNEFFNILSHITFTDYTIFVLMKIRILWGLDLITWMNCKVSEEFVGISIQIKSVNEYRVIFFFSFGENNELSDIVYGWNKIVKFNAQSTWNNLFSVFFFILLGA